VRLRFLLPLILLAGCGGLPKSAVQRQSTPATTTPTLAPTATFSASPSTIQKGQFTKLTWSTANAGTVTITGIGAVGPQGSLQVVPAATTSYQLTAQGSGGTTQVSTHVNVQTGSTPAPAPTAALSLSSSTIQSGQSANLTWHTTNAWSVSISGIGTVGAQGSLVVAPSATTTYQLTAKGDGGTSYASARLTVSTTTPPAAPHVVLIIEENRSFSTVYPIGMPWMSALGNAYGIATNYYSDQSGSMLDYLWLSSGSGEQTFGCAGWGCLQTITDDNIFRELNKTGLSWKVYAESLPYAGFMGSSYGYYVKRHNPAPWYSDVVNSTAQQQKMVPFTQFAKDLAANNLPNYSVIVPNLLDDAHDGSISAADQWLKTNIGPLLNSPYFKLGGNGILFITFDNGDADRQGLVFTGVVGQSVIPGKKVSTAYRHENTLRTIMEKLGLTHFPGASATASPMNDFFK